MTRKSTALKRIAIGSGIAAAAGYVAGILTAPKAGKQTRQEIQGFASKNMQSAEKDLKNLHTELGGLISDYKKSGAKVGNKTKTDISDIVEKAKDTKEKVREMLSAIHEGGADDKDLERAVKDARAAIDHLRDYLKK